MPFAPDYADFVRMKRLQTELTVGRTLDARKTRAGAPNSGYRAAYSITSLPPNYLPGRQYSPVAPPAPAPGTYTTLGSITLDETVSTTYSAEIYVEFASGTTMVDFGDGTTRELTSGAPIPHLYPEPSSSDKVPYTIRLTNAENITFLGIGTPHNISVNIDPFVCLFTFNASDCPNLLSIGTIPVSLETLDIENTSVRSIDIPPQSSLVIIVITDSNVSNIAGIQYAENLTTLFMPRIPITDCNSLQNIFDNLHNRTSTSAGTVTYSPGTCDTNVIEATAITHNWTFTRV